MKILIVFYSRTGYTQKAALELQARLKCDIEEIVDLKDHSGILGYIRAGRDATLKRLTHIRAMQKDISKYDLVVIGTPVWAFTMSTPIRTFLHENKDKLNSVALYCTQGGSGSKQCFKDMIKLVHKIPKALMTLDTKDFKTSRLSEKIGGFVRIVSLLKEKTRKSKNISRKKKLV